MAVDTAHGSPVALPAGLKRQFYPPLVLLFCLNNIVGHQRPRPEDTFIELSPGQGPEKTIQAFVSKLALVCSTEPGGDSVSACTVLQLPDRLQYVFASNKRSKLELERIGNGIRSILLKLQNGVPRAEGQRASLYFTILHEVLSLCEPRVRSYLRCLRDELGECIKSCHHKDTEQSSSLQSWLQALLDVVYSTFTTEQGRSKIDIRAVASLVSSIREIQESGAYRIVRSRFAAAEVTRNPNCWYELHHIAGRLKSYDQAVRVFFRTRGDLPELFESFDVNFVPSSERMSSPLQAEPKEVKAIVKVMSSVPHLLSVYDQQADRLRHLGLDPMIKSVWNGEPIIRPGSRHRTPRDQPPKRFEPVVHAEILLHDWLENTEGGTDRTRFFLQHKYIGTSKPTCRLCSYFFEIHETDVQVRPSHRTVYLPWRMPNIYGHQGEGAVLLRRRVMSAIKQRICSDIAIAMRERVGAARPHDSDTYSMITRASSLAPLRSGLGMAMAQMAGGLQSLSITDAEPEPSTRSLRKCHEVGNSGVPERDIIEHEADEDDENDDDSGTIVFQGRRGR